MTIYYADNFRNQSAFFRSDAKTAFGMAKAAIQALYIYQAYTQSVEVYETVCIGGVRRRKHVALTFDFVLDAIY